MHSQTYLNPDESRVKISEMGFQDIIKSVIFTSDIAINKMCNDKFYVLCDNEEISHEYGLCMYENINDECHLKNIIINPYDYNNYSFLFQSFIDLIAKKKANTILNIDNLPYHLQLEYIINYGNEQL
tara:strand:+ start:929 stop:1309 length:381 start_codon:yes stop_codon:yes gene_type:complete